MGIKELQEMLNVKHKQTVYTLIKKHNLPTYVVGGNYRFDEEKVREWLKKREINSTK